MHLGGSFPCELCGRVYGTHQKLNGGHVDTVHRLLQKRFQVPKVVARALLRVLQAAEAPGRAPRRGPPAVQVQRVRQVLRS
ncbi:unnamed protein product, partial [Iphiclides podalirius]